MKILPSFATVVGLLVSSSLWAQVPLPVAPDQDLLVRPPEPQPVAPNVGFPPAIPTEIEPEEEKLPEPTVKQLEQLVAGLGAEAFDIRERSQAALDKYAKQYPELLQKTLVSPYLKSSDPEVRYRLGKVVYNAVSEEIPHSGFLGILMMGSQTVLDGRKVVGSIRISQVLPNTAAARAGLRMGDHIIQVDKMTFNTMPPQQQAVPAINHPNLDKFKTYIGNQKEGSSVDLQVRRYDAGKQRDLKVRVNLGRRPADLVDKGEADRKERYFDQWLAEERQRLGVEE